jgi:hypothetical protein
MPLDPKYKDPFKKVLPPPQEEGPSNSLAITEPYEQQEPEPFKLANVPLFTDAQGKKQVDYSNLAQGMYKSRAQDYDDNKVSRQELDDSRDRSTANTIIAGLSKASAAVGGTQTYVPETADALNKEAASNLQARTSMANKGYDDAQKSLGEMQEAPLKMQKADEILKATDPNSELSKFTRKYYQGVMKSKQGLPETMSAADLSKIAPDIVRIASDQMQRDFQRELSRSSQNFQAKQGELGFERDVAMNDMKAEQARQLRQAEIEKQGKAKLIEDRMNLAEKKAVNLLTDQTATVRFAGSMLDSRAQEMRAAKTDRDKIAIGQTMLKAINSMQGADAVALGEVKILANELFPVTLQGVDGMPRVGTDIPGFLRKVDALIRAANSSANFASKEINKVYQKYDPTYEAMTVDQDTQQQPNPERRVWTPGGN